MKPDGEMKLYLDGAAADSLTGKQIDVGPTDSTMAVGRDQDGSPDYGNADFDDLFVYGRALAHTEIAEAVEMVKRGEQYDRPAKAGARSEVKGWWSAARPCRAEVAIPAQDTPRENVSVQCPLAFGADLAALGLSGAVDERSVRVVEESVTQPESSNREVSRLGPLLPAVPCIPVRIEDGVAEWQAPARTGAGAERRFRLYFKTTSHEIEKPLVSHRIVGADETQPAPPAPPDYASLTYGKPWDFNDGTFAGIDLWGDKPEFVRNKKVENGILSMDVQDDAYFIWGHMWGQAPKADQKLSVDLDKFPVLEMKVRQSVNRSNWKLYGRPGVSEQLLTYDFVVAGTGWQRIRINLKKHARWRGVLTALRIDPSKMQPAHIEIDWVRLTAVALAEHARVETIGAPSGRAASVEVSAPQTTITAGAAQEIAVTVKDAAGKPVAGQPVRIELAKGSNGELAGAEKQKSLALGPRSRRGLTDATGLLVVNYAASKKAAQAADTLLAKAEFAEAPEAKLAVSTVAGPPHHYRVEPTTVFAVKSSELPLSISAGLVDKFDNLAGAPRQLAWTTDEGAQVAAAGPVKASWQGDEKKRWVYRVRVKDERGLEGESAPICLLPSGPRTDPVVLGPNGYFRKSASGEPASRTPGSLPAQGEVSNRDVSRLEPLPDGASVKCRGWLPLGGFYANWVGLPQNGEEGRKIISFVDATEDELVHWLDFLSKQGVTAMRFMLRAHTQQGTEPMDVIGRVNMPLFAKVLRYMDLARKHDIRFMLTIHEDYTKPAYYDQQALETFCIPRYEGKGLDTLSPHQRRFIRDRKLIGSIEEKYTDPDVMACQDQYARELVGLLKDNPQLFAWELENEMVNCPQSWANHMTGIIRSVDSVTPICASHGGDGLRTADPLWWTHKTSIDFYTYHLYPQGATSSEIDFGAAVDVLACYGRMAGACMLGETAGDEFSQYPKDRDADRRYIMRDLIWLSLVNGNPGCFFWNARGFEVEQFRLANQIASGLEWSNWVRQTPEIGIVVAHPWDDDKYYRTPQGRDDYAMLGRCAQHYLSAGVDFDFTMDGLGYAKTAQLGALGRAPVQWAPPPGTPRLAVTPGWQVRANARKGLGEGLAYVRNFAGARQWQQPNINMYVRDRKAAPLKIRLNLPVEKLVVWATDLDTGDEKRFETTGTGEIDLGANDHDWALVWRTR